MDSNALLLTDRVAVVTGAAQGIGKATALAFADLGSHVAICDTLEDGLQETVREIRDRGVKVISSVIDVRESSLVAEFFEKVRVELGLVDVLVNNAGGEIGRAHV